VWAVVGFIVPYIPVGQQRKLVMGLHIPLCILCALAVTEVLRWLRASKRIEELRQASCFGFPLLRTGSLPGILLVCVVASPMLFIFNDITLLDVDRTVTIYQPFISRAELDAMRYLHDNSAPTDSVFAPPTFALFTPALAARPVYYGHWSETPDYVEKFRQWIAFIDHDTPEPVRADILRSSRAKYYVSLGKDTLPPEMFQTAYLTRVFAEGDVVVFRVKSSLPVFAMLK
jgi:hypothetical protein